MGPHLLNSAFGLIQKLNSKTNTVDTQDLKSSLSQEHFPFQRGRGMLLPHLELCHLELLLSGLETTRPPPQPHDLMFDLLASISRFLICAKMLRRQTKGAILPR